jgi:hypothetical protein
MEDVFLNFYRNFYMRTGGYIPSKPLNVNIYPGDFFQVRNGEVIMLGNIFRKGVVAPQDVEFENAVRLNPAGWNFSDGISKPYSGRGSGHGPIEGEFEFSRQVISFNKRGSFFFKGNYPEAVKIMNWGDLQQQLIIKMTQTIFSFRELYIVTETATTSDWTLAISGSEKGELEVATDSENFGLVDIFGHHSAKTIQSKEIEYYHREEHRKPSFFKAKKLAVQDEKLEVFISELIGQMTDRDTWASGFFEYEFYNDSSFTPQIPVAAQAGLLDMLQASQLNPNTALLYFKWADASLDDIEKLFLVYGR